MSSSKSRNTREISDIFHFAAKHFLLERHSAMVLIYMLSSKYGFGQSMDCLHKVWILTLSGQSMDCLLNPRIERLGQSMDWCPNKGMVSSVAQ